jgi:hypothetical protein
MVLASIDASIDNDMHSKVVEDGKLGAAGA